MNQAILLTGGNIGNRESALQNASLLIESRIGHIEKSSSIYETDAWGKKNQNAFYNQVHVVKTDLTVDNLMQTILQIEEEMGRIRTEKNAARIIDIDILFYNDSILSSTLVTIPHPQIENRRFVLIPLTEVTPGFIHPKLNKTVELLLHETRDTLEVRKLTAHV